MFECSKMLPLRTPHSFSTTSVTFVALTPNSTEMSGPEKRKIARQPRTVVLRIRLSGLLVMRTVTQIDEGYHTTNHLIPFYEGGLN